jgi:hypothetical protein
MAASRTGKRISSGRRSRSRSVFFGTPARRLDSRLSSTRLNPASNSAGCPPSSSWNARAELIEGPGGARVDCMAGLMALNFLPGSHDLTSRPQWRLFITGPLWHIVRSKILQAHASPAVVDVGRSRPAGPSSLASARQHAAPGAQMQGDPAVARAWNSSSRGVVRNRFAWRVSWSLKFVPYRINILC